MLVIPVKIYYNADIRAFTRGYEAGDTLALVFDDVADLLYVPTMGIDDVIRGIREGAFQAFNGALHSDDMSVPLYRRMVLRYRDGDIRSMSVGDVIVISDKAWAVAPNGWDVVTLKAHF